MCDKGASKNKQESHFLGLLGPDLGWTTVRFELAYSDFDDIEIVATGNTVANDVKGQNKINADADVLLAKISFAF